MRQRNDENPFGAVISGSLPSIAVRLPLLVIGAILAITIITGVVGSSLTRVRLEALIFDNLRTLATIQGEQIENKLRQHATLLENLATSEEVRLQVSVANNTYNVLTEERAASILQERQTLWRQAIAQDGVQSSHPLVLNVRLNEMTRQIFQPESASLQANLDVQSDFILTDKMGAVIGGSYVPQNYLQTNSAWWQAVQATGVLYVGGPVLDMNKGGLPVIEFATPVRDGESGEMVGALYSTFEYAAIKDVITHLQFGDTGRSALLDNSGYVFYTVSSQDQLTDTTMPLSELLSGLHTFEGREKRLYVTTAVPVESSIKAIQELGWHTATIQDRSKALEPVDQAVGPAIITASGFGLLIVFLLYWFYIRPLIRDLDRLRAGAEALQQGSLQPQVNLDRHDELGLLATTFNEMARRLRNQIETQEQIIAQRTAALRKQARQLEAVAHVGRAANASLDLEELMSEAVNLIRNSFGFYHVSIFLIDGNNEYAVVRESTGEVGRIMKEKPHKLAVGSESIVGWVTRHREPRIALNVGEDAVHFNNPLLPDTRSEAALPLVAQGEMLGALDVQSSDANAFTQDDLAILQLMVDQLAAAIYNAHLYQQATQSQRETETLFNLTALLTTTLDVQEIYRRAARSLTLEINASRCAISTWDRTANTVTTQIEYIHDITNQVKDQYDTTPHTYNLEHHTGTLKVLDLFEPVVRHVDDPTIEAAERELLLETNQILSLEVALVTGNEARGIVELYRTQGQPPFTTQEIRLVQAMAGQIATVLNNATLTSEAHGRVAELSTLYRISQALSVAPDLKSVLTSAQQEIMSLTNATGMGVRLLNEAKDKLHWLYVIEYGSEIDVSNIPPLSISEGLSGYVARTGQPLLLNEISEETLAQYGSRVVAGGMSESFVGIPLLVTNELIGVLTVDNGDETNAFNQRDVQLLTTVASSLSIAIQNQRLLDQMQEALMTQSQQSLRLQAAAEVSTAASNILNIDELLQTAVDLIQERFALYYVGIFLVNKQSSQAVLKAGTGEAGRLLLSQNQQLPIGGRSLIGQATTTGQSRIAQDVHLDDNWLPNPALPETRSELALPLRVRGKIKGALTVQSVEANEFSPELVSILQTMCDQLAGAIDNTQLLVQAEARARQQEMLNKVGARLHRTADAETIISIGLQALSEQLNGAPVELRLGQSVALESEKKL